MRLLEGFIRNIWFEEFFKRFHKSRTMAKHKGCSKSIIEFIPFFYWLTKRKMLKICNRNVVSPFNGLIQFFKSHRVKNTAAFPVNNILHTQYIEAIAMVLVADAFRIMFLLFVYNKAHYATVAGDEIPSLLCFAVVFCFFFVFVYFLWFAFSFAFEKLFFLCTLFNRNWVLQNSKEKKRIFRHFYVA